MLWATHHTEVRGVGSFSTTCYYIITLLHTYYILLAAAMGKKRARHSKGNNKSDGKRQRAEREEKWKSTRGDSGSGHNTPPVNEK